MEPKWLAWARRLAAVAHNGLVFALNPFDVERYEQVREIAAEIISSYSQSEKPVVPSTFSPRQKDTRRRGWMFGVLFSRATKSCSCAKRAINSGVFRAAGRMSVRPRETMLSGKSARKRV